MIATDLIVKIKTIKINTDSCTIQPHKEIIQGILWQNKDLQV